MSDEPKRRFFTGDTLQQALVQAANYHNLEPEYIAYKAIEKRHGFLKVRRRVVIEVDPDAPRRDAPVAIPATPGPPPRAAQPVVREARPAGAGAPRREERSGRPERPGGPPRRDGREGGRGDRRERERDRRGGERREERGPRRERGPERGPERAEREPRPERALDAGGEAGPPPLEQAPERRLPRATARPVLPSTPDYGPEIDLDDSLVILPERPRPVGDRYPAASGPVAEAAQKGLDLLLGVANLRLSARIHQGEGRLEIDLSGEDADFCFDEEGEILRAIEHLLPRVIRAATGEAIPCRVDCESFHEIREEQLRSLAQRVAEEVRRRGRSRTLEPMNPADRRIVHMTLADDPHVETESEGDGYFKRIVVRPV
jgi:spoIIIJ-associated protein